MFKIKINKIFNIGKEHAKILVGEATDLTYTGKLFCDDIQINVTCRLTGAWNKDNVSLMVQDKKEMELINDSIIGKVFTSERI